MTPTSRASSPHCSPPTARRRRSSGRRSWRAPGVRRFGARIGSRQAGCGRGHRCRDDPCDGCRRYRERGGTGDDRSRTGWCAASAKVAWVRSSSPSAPTASSSRRWPSSASGPASIRGDRRPVPARARDSARLDHPGIARLLDGGSTDVDVLYFVSSMSRGADHRRCEQRAVLLERRIQLMIEVADAVDAAHRQLVVDRDLKPTNILVIASGRVKLLISASRSP